MPKGTVIRTPDNNNATMTPAATTLQCNFNNKSVNIVCVIKVQVTI